MLRLRILLVGLLYLGSFTGCVPASVASRPVALPNGQQGYDIRCNGTHHDVGDCMNEAARACGGPYHVVTQTGEDVGAAAMGMPAGSGTSAVMVRGIHRNLIVECGATAAGQRAGQP
jgi:hypothetical protein